MSDFRKFMQNGGAKDKGEQAPNSGANDKTSPIKKDGTRKSQMEYLQDLAQYYNEHGEEKLIADIFRSVSEQKSLGKISNEEILRLSKTLGAMLDPSQKERLDDIVNKLTK